MSVDIQAIANLLRASLDPSQNRQAERALKNEEARPGFSLALLQIVATASFPQDTRLASALFFKNFVKRHWTDENGNHQLPQNEVNTIKAELVGLMVRVPPNIQSQLGDATGVIADSDFYQRWDTLVDDLVSRLTPDDPTVNNGVLQVAHSIFCRWEPLYRSDELYTEINHVLSRFASPFLQFWQRIDQTIAESADKPDVLRANFTTLDLIIKLIYDLSTHDLPPQFEENLGAIAEQLHKYLTYDNKALHTDDDDEAGPLEHVRVGVFRVLVLYSKMYDEDFRPYMTPFIETSWNLLTGLGPQSKYDAVVGRALEFLTIVVGLNQYAQQFNSADVLGQITEKVVVPNVSLRESDIETFEDEPIEFIRKDLEGSDEGTRRRAAIGFLRKLMEQFEDMVTTVVMRYVNHFLAEYAKDQKSNWKAKDTAVQLFSSIGAKGVATAAKGVLSVNPHVNVLEFFQKNIVVDLTNSDAQPILKVDAIKYLHIFRSILNAEQWVGAFPLLVQHLNSPNYVVYTYAAVAVDRALYMTDADGQPVISRDSVVSLSKDLLQHLFKLISKDSKPEKVQENEFLMKCVMRVVIVLREKVSSVLDMVLTNLVNILKVVRHNPSNPGFCYFLFESLGAVIRFAGPSDPVKVEGYLFTPLTETLGLDVDEFKPYIFQLLAAMVESNPSDGVTTNMQALVQPTLTITNWDSKGNVPALNRFLCNVLPKCAEQIAAANQTEAVLSIFQKLLFSKAYEVYAMDLLEAIVTSFNITALENYWKTILQLLFTRLKDSKTETFTLRFIRFYHLISALPSHGADFFIAVSDQVQKDVFTPIYIQTILPGTQKLVRPLDRKTAVISLTRTLADSQAFVDRYYKRGWTITCQALLQLLINPPVPPQSKDDVIEDRDEDLGFGAAYTQLNTCKSRQKDLWPDVMDVKSWVGRTLKDADSRHGGRISRFVQEKLSNQERAALQMVMTS
ncbi:Cse1-domain-containing protein [Piedraia hortae CBS 480.64]|uniref:Cse1-domain-containing protein n=1 Tax=Piedraia hortae CBS 480.64 TaxID=1314780 RepID=A0A6A7C2S2_9PEZI|nr:Cse1-domain-containing protein [Piedraia hortae CBS 480.64]